MKIGVIGCGKIAEKHLNAYRKLKGVEVTVADIVEKGKVVAESYGAKWCDNPDNLIAGDTVTAIDVCIPTPSHAEVILKSLDSRKHVFCEKPLARNLEEALRIQERASNVGKIVMVGYLYRFHPAFQFVRDVLQEGIIGEPYYAILRLGGRGSHKAWKHLRETGGGAANEMLVHMLDLALWYFGEVKGAVNLYADTVLKERVIEGRVVKTNAEDLILIKMEMQNGTKVICESDLLSPSYMNYLEVHGTNGSLWSSILDFFPTAVYCKKQRGRYNEGYNFFRFPHTDLFELELSHFIECIKKGDTNPLNSVADSIKIMRLTESLIGKVTSMGEG